ncbi:hypothetical protein L1887_11908 [Cichorium endivia]|nr:hypothetical protein L1887_11908 [Cichorium endivia]
MCVGGWFVGRYVQMFLWLWHCLNSNLSTFVCQRIQFVELCGKHVVAHEFGSFQSTAISVKNGFHIRVRTGFKLGSKTGFKTTISDLHAFFDTGQGF